MAIIARDPDTGMARWVYQMTPHDQWDYDGVNEMILTEQAIDGRPRRVLTHFDRNGFGYTLDRATGEVLVAEKIRSQRELGAPDRPGHASPGYGRPVVDKRYAPGEADEEEVTKNICPGALGAKNQQPAAYSPVTRLFYVPTNHMCMDYEAFRVSYTPGQPYVGATLTLHPPEGSDRTGAFIAWDGAGTDRLDDPGTVLGLVRGARHRRQRRLLRHARRLPEGGRRPGRARALPLQDPVGHRRQRHHLSA